jgi:hypothetical protein
MNYSHPSYAAVMNTDIMEYEEFVPRKEYPVGGFFKIGNEVFKVVAVTCSEPCKNCEFNNRGTDNMCRDFRCVWKNAILYDTLDN